jgi:hypothetical protein
MNLLILEPKFRFKAWMPYSCILDPEKYRFSSFLQNLWSIFKSHALFQGLQGQFIAGLIHCESIPRGSIHCRVESLQVRFIAGRFIAGLIHRRVDSSQNYVNCKLDWNVIFFWLDIQNWVRFVVKTFSLPLGATEKVVLLKFTWLKCMIFGLNMKTGFI